MSSTPTLKKALNQRQLTMIAIGGVIGAGLFVGSGVVIKDTGPGAFITYALAGVLIIMVMRMLAEMAVANPSTGSFADYARNALGNWAGFSVGWLYWYFWVIVVGFEAIAGAKIIQYWVDIPLWLSALVLLVLMTGTNLFSVSSFGEFEFWFAGIKVAAIVVFIALNRINETSHNGTPGSQYWTIFAPAMASNPTMITQKYQYSQPTEKPAQPPSALRACPRTTRSTGWPPPSRPASA